MASLLNTLNITELVLNSLNPCSPVQTKENLHPMHLMLSKAAAFGTPTNTEYIPLIPLSFTNQELVNQQVFCLAFHSTDMKVASLASDSFSRKTKTYISNY